MEQPERTAFSSPVAGKAIRATFDGGRLTSDAGVLVLAEIERRLGIAYLLLTRSPVYDPLSAGVPAGESTLLSP